MTDERVWASVWLGRFGSPRQSDSPVDAYHESTVGQHCDVATDGHR
ncbi:hypothetical protein JOF56_008347 [Kibdelosporangium banguiense]|uniref:Uncharacterized protein n=1 Tax=Kibdelosporangium banguiense TaxID=1365924 RepID=A0ABS4TUA6_9PSEU|nr:hypothetical protein [Kibdelosporangium banguiense]MBP2327962.1 hypothetical protein [Kibdelosporangium banguiense]